ncbi:hypothetical protein [Paraburkholderia graminis]|uniref:hypothetical protein n=1 Tax=Paraburkholderia graminis TaxID=60548 RepID=UPI0038B6B889
MNDLTAPGLCSAADCPLPASFGKFCFCHIGRPSSSHNAITRELNDRQAHIVGAVCAIRQRAGSFADVPETYRTIQRAFIAAECRNLLLGELDCSPHKPGRPSARLWLCRLERELLDATGAAAGQARHVTAALGGVIGATRCESSNPYASQEL